MSSVATGCCKKSGSLLVENAIEASLWHRNFVYEHVPITLHHLFTSGHGDM